MQFDDDRLKAAIKQAWGSHAAGPELRERLMQTLTAARAESSTDTSAETPGPIPIRPRTPWRFARLVGIAACLLLVIGGATLRYVRIHHDREEYEEYVQANHDLFASMVMLQTTPPDEKASAQQLPIDGSSASVQADAAHKLGRAIPLPNLTSAGWVLNGVTLCPFRGSTAAKFDFAKGTSHLTLLSVPLSLVAGADEVNDYELVEQGHSIAGFIEQGSLNCVIGDAALSLPDAISLRNILRHS